MTMFSFVIIFVVLLIILLCIYIRRFNIFIINYAYLVKFLLFNFITLIYYFIYLSIYSIFFIYKNYRFYSYYYLNIGTVFFYFSKKSIYFLFWRYLVIYLITTVLFFLNFVINSCLIFIKKIFYINNINTYVFIYFKIKYIKTSKSFLIYLYNYIITIIYYFFYFINIDEIYLWLKVLRTNIFNFFKYKIDPIGDRNGILTWSSNIYNLYYKYINLNLFSINLFNFKIIHILKKIIYILITYFTWLLYLNFNFNKDFLIKNLLSNVYLSNRIIKKNIFIISLKMLFYIINLIIVNMIYCICILLTYSIYSIFLFCNEFKYIFFYILLLLFCIKYYWIFYYFFLLLYNHYFLDLPLFEIKESTRFFNFEYIDLRNYFNLIFLHNTLIDLSVFNNVIYNDLLNNLNKTLSVYGFKINSQYDINLYSLLDVRNKDTKLLNDLLNVYNNHQSYSLLQWYNTLKNKLTDKVSHDLFNYSKKSYKDYRFYRKAFEKNAATASLDNKEDSFINLKSSYFFHLGHKENYITWKFFNTGYFTQNTLKTISAKSVSFIKLNQIPLKYIHLYHKDKYAVLNKNVLPYFDLLHFSVQKHITYFIEWFKKWVKEENYYFYFNNIYDFDNYKYNLKMKHKIPSFQWTTVRWRRKMPNTARLNATGVSLNLDEQQSWSTFYEMARRKLKKKRLFKIFYMDYKYPFSMLKKKHIFDVLNNNSNINIKIIKKYYFLKNTKIYSMKRYHKKLLYTNHLLMRLFFYRLNHWDGPFFKNHLTNKYKEEDEKDFFNYNFWFFFDYLKTDKYYYSKYNEFYKNEESDINLYFLKRIRKDYIKLRNNLLRLYSLYFHYYILEAPNTKHLFFNNSLPAHIKNERLLWSYDNFKINWLLKIYLTKERANIELFNNVSFLSRLFKSRFFAYFVYCDYTINSYNDLFYIKNKSYRLRVLNKINNLKRFFYFQNKHVSGWSILKYIRSFSLSYHIKHFLWHSPYSFLLFKDTFIVQNNNFTISNFVNSYNIISPTIKKELILINPLNYLMLFNLFLNIIEINNNWFYILNYNHLDIKSNIEFFNLCNKIFLKTYYNYYNNGISVLMPFHFIDIYRFLMNFLFEYYNNFLYKLIRYRYILNYKNYTFLKFLERYFNEWYNQIYPRIRTQLYRYLAYGKMMKWFWSSQLNLKAINVFGFRAYRKNFLPIWFLCDYYIKLFIYFLLEKYYTKEFFILYWLNWFSNYLFYNYFLILFFLNFFNFKYFLFKNFNIISNINFLNIYNFFINVINKKNIYIWYMWIILKYDINIFYNFNYIKGYLIIKWFFLSINKTMFSIFEINLNKFILIKIYIEKLISYYFNVLFNIKNSLVFFKSNYYYYNKQRHSGNFYKTKIYNTVFKNTITYRNIYSFSHLTYNITFFKNIYLSNIYNYIYFMNMYHLNINNIFNIFFFIFKYNYIYFLILMYLLFYWFIILMLYIYYKKFYNVFFFTYTINVDPQYNWKKAFNDKAIKMSNSYNNKKYKIYKLIWLNKINHNFYKFYLLNTFINKLSLSKSILYKILFNNNKYNNFKNLNNNEILELHSDTNIKMWPVVSFSYYLNFFNSFTIMPFKLKKENILYNFNFLNLFNNNLFNFCFFYWIILIPYFFFEYVLNKYYLKGHVLIKHKLIVILKILLDNFKLYVSCFKYIGEGMHLIEKQKFPRSYNGYSIYKKKKYYNYFLKWDKFTVFHTRVSYLGNYYYWFFRINKIEYFLSFKNYFFNFSYNSIYFYYIYIYIFFLIIIMRRYRNKILLLNKAEIANKYKT